jgi:hypothetical protein
MTSAEARAILGDDMYERFAVAVPVPDEVAHRLARAWWQAGIGVQPRTTRASDAA